MQPSYSVFITLFCLTTWIPCLWSHAAQAQFEPANASPLKASDHELNRDRLQSIVDVHSINHVAQYLRQNVSVHAADLTSNLSENSSEFAIAESGNSTIKQEDWSHPIVAQSADPAASHSPTNLSESAIRAYVLGFQVPAAAAIGFPIASTRVYITNPSGNRQTDQTYQKQIAAAFALSGGDNFSTLFAERGLDRVQQLPFVSRAEYRVFEAETDGQVTVLIAATISDKPTQKPTQPSGVLVTGNLRDFPNLYTSDRAKFVGILNAGMANFLNANTWFGQSGVFTQGNPLAIDPAGKGTYSWQDFYFEPGFGGITRLGQSPLYAYGSASFIGAATLNPDLFRSDK